MIFVYCDFLLLTSNEKVFGVFGPHSCLAGDATEHHQYTDLVIGLFR